MKPLLAPLTLAVLLLSPWGGALAEPLTPNLISISLRSSELDDALHGEAMVEIPINETLSGRFGVAFFHSEQTDLHGGLELGLRANFGATISPFIGAGVFLGSWSETVAADSDGIDNDNDYLIDEWDEEVEEVDTLLAAYPEVGVHLWLGERLRLTGSARYYVTTAGRDSDRRMVGFGIGFAF